MIWIIIFTRFYVKKIFKRNNQQIHHKVIIHLNNNKVHKQIAQISKIKDFKFIT
jgi:hypothetical protein